MESAHLSPAAAERLREELAERSGPRRLMITDRALLTLGRLCHQQGS